MAPKISLIASSIRPQLYNFFFESLKEETIEYEVIFAGNCSKQNLPEYPNFKYIETANIKPAQCYEICRREAKGELIHWTADDAEYKGGILTKAYEYWKQKNNKKLILSLQTREFYLGGGDHFCDMTLHAFHGSRRNTPLMAPLALLSREYLEELGGFDSRFICGQYENLTVCQAYADDGQVEIYGNRKYYIEIDHINKSKLCGESKNIDEFYKRPFALGYQHDRQILEKAVIIDNGKVLIKSFEPYEDKNLLIESQSHKGVWV